MARMRLFGKDTSFINSLQAIPLKFEELSSGR
jgi:hypothetical protein